MSAARDSRGSVGIPAGYRRPRIREDVDLRLDANEGRPPSAAWLRGLALDDPSRVAGYPDAGPLERRLAERHGLASEQVLVTAGADEAIDRACRVALTPDRALLLPVPTFEMFELYARSASAPVVRVDWSGEWPRRAVLERLDTRVGMVAMVSPNNPTGSVATVEDLDAVADTLPEGSLLLLDAAYGDFSDEDLTAHALERGDVVVLRSFSKAHGLAGLRVGYAAGPTEWIARLRAVGGPYPVAAPSLRVAEAALDDEAMTEAGRVWRRVREERRLLREELVAMGAACQPSQANFVLARVGDSAFVDQALQSLGIAVRRWPGREGLGDALRIGCPAGVDDFNRLRRALRSVLAPEAMLFDMDGVLADEGPSFREAIRATAAGFGLEVTREDIGRVKAAGSCNDDWELTHRLLQQAGIAVDFETVRARFEEHYQGGPGREGLWAREELLVAVEELRELSRRFRLAVVTGRPRRDAERFLERFDLLELFDVLVGMEDAAAKPDPEPVRLALARLGVRAAWMIGDTPDDVLAARGAGVVPLGILAPDPADAVPAEALRRAGCVRVLDSLSDLRSLLP